MLFLKIAIFLLYFGVGLIAGIFAAIFSGSRDYDLNTFFYHFLLWPKALIYDPWRKKRAIAKRNEEIATGAREKPPAVKDQDFLNKYN